MSGTHASATRSDSASDAPGGNDRTTLKESSLNGGRKLDPKSFATIAAPATIAIASSRTVFGNLRAPHRNGR